MDARRVGFQRSEEMPDTPETKRTKKISKRIKFRGELKVG
jgi:hypothetical protein